jgi:hypothetical protein
MGVDALKVRQGGKVERVGWGRAVLAVLGAFAAVSPSLACVATSVMTSNAPVPVVVGPVACIGCRRTTASSQISAPIADSAVHTNGYVTLPRIGDVDFFGDTPATIDAKAVSLAPDPCAVDVQLSKITASSFGIVAIVYADAKQTVKVAGGVRPVPGGSCLMPSGTYVVTGGGAPTPGWAPGRSP